MNRTYGWIKQKLDKRDVKYSIENLLPIKTVYLNPDSGYLLPPIWDQLALGACTSFGWAFLVMFDLLNKKFQEIPASGYSPSQLFIYWFERVLRGTTGQDSGAEIRDGAKAINQHGCCSSALWPYNVNTFTTPPSPNMLSNALNYVSVQYKSLDNTNKQQIVDALQRGFPVVFGTSVYESFESQEVASSGIVPYPDVNNEKYLGGHCMAIVGYHEGIGDDDTFIVRNSWGTDWGKGGYCRIPTRYLCDADLASDFWILELVK